ncbi:hypothetical protein FB554_3210 [Barrientosiimonas humi]|uniref:4-amino-4-deoxy-L-arabinose transferase-like glycosyltransferase n=1 Tax=Barrientosiimonas humi TaxID=999931 RepID=A0A542WZD8_9MICO|nr:hypothetical protein [Barrientosiimonas humi]TQL28902.1 hypothetical protein FB554_3210 [Barrientosiimonas humi]CAG7571262.1 hypothetical protein BH39T_PBIAJDOK_00278 [Barrientosiimonas humi]
MLTRLRRGGLGGQAAVTALFGLTFGYLTLRSFLGVDLADGSYPLVLSRRVAHGAMPLADEQGLHVFGSLPAAPFVLVWEAAFGSTGLILATRLFTVAWIAVVVLVCQRALTPTLPPLPVAAGLCGVTLALPYAVIGTTYNTVAMFGLLLATCAGFAAVHARPRGWLPTAAVAAPVASIAFPGVTPGAVCLLLALLVVLRRQGASWAQIGRNLALPAALVVVALLVFLTVGPGWDQVEQSVADQRTARPATGGLGSVLDLFSSWLGGYLTEPGKLPLALLAAAAAAVLPWRQAAAAAALAAAGLLLWFASAQPGANMLDIDDGTYPGAMGVLASVVLLPIAVRCAGRDAATRQLLLLSAVTLPSLLGVQAMTASGFTFGAIAAGGAPFALAVFVAFAQFLSRPDLGRGWQVGLLAPALITGACLTAVVFNEGTTFQQRNLVTSGPAAGLWVSDSSVTRIRAVETLADRCPAEARALVVGAPGGYLWLPARSAAMGSWLGNDAVQSIPVERQLARRPTCILAARAAADPDWTAADQAVLDRLAVGMRPVGRPVFLHTSPTLGDIYVQVYAAGQASSGR